MYSNHLENNIKSLVERKNNLFERIQKCDLYVEEYIKEYKKILERLLELSDFKDDNIKKELEEINAKENYIIGISGINNCISIVTNTRDHMTSYIESNISILENKYLPLIKEAEYNGINIVSGGHYSLEIIIRNAKDKIDRRKSRENKKLLDGSNYIAFDLETTGLNSISNEIIEIAALKVKDGKIVDIFNYLVKPSKKIPKKITQLTGISNEMVEDKKSIIEVLPQFINFTEKLPLVSHNINFDYGFINESYKKITGRNLKIRKYCTMEIYKKWYKEKYEWYPLGCKLGNVIEDIFGYDEFEKYKLNAHRALNDAEYVQKIYSKIYNPFQ